MGACFNTTVKNIPKTEPTAQAPSRNSLEKTTTNYGLRNEVSTRTLVFENAPLINNEFLYNKFHHDSNRPDELNLQWQIVGVQQVGAELKVSLINLVRVRLWVVAGGTERKAMTGLYARIQDYHSCHCLDVDPGTPPTYPHSLSLPLPSRPLRLILQSLSSPLQSLSLIYSYSASLSPLRQQLMWNNLAFQLQTIYNQNQAQLNDNNRQQTQCVICNTELATCILVPCKHMCICKGCIAMYKGMYGVCPLCKVGYEEIVIYRGIEA